MSKIFEKSLDKGHSACYYEHMNRRSYEYTAKGAVHMPETKDPAPALQPEGPDMPDDEVLYELADLFRVFGDSTRIKILYALHDNELCVQDIADAVQLSQSAVSHQLRVLKDSKLFSTHWTMTMCAASSRWGWTISKNDFPGCGPSKKKGWYFR